MSNKNYNAAYSRSGNQSARRRLRKSNGKSAAIITLSILLGLSLVFGITAAFFTSTAGASGNITLGNPVTINVTQGGASVSALTFAGNAMPGTIYDQSIGVSMPANTSDSVVRGKLTITNTEGASETVDATTSESWVLGEDGYHYYNGKLTASQNVDFVSQITVPKTLTNADANKTYAISIQIEAIQFANGAAAEVWSTAPSDWVTAYGSGTIA